MGSASRRDILRLLAGGAALAFGGAPAPAGEARIERLIAEARGLCRRFHNGSISSPAALRGTRYQGYTLIGGPRRPEKFVLRDDAFDCVTFCETVLAAARARDIDRIRDGAAGDPLSQRLCELVRAQSLFLRMVPAQCRQQDLPLVGMDGAVDIEKTVDSQKGLSRRQFSMRVIPSAIFLANKAMLEAATSSAL